MRCNNFWLSGANAISTKYLISSVNSRYYPVEGFSFPRGQGMFVCI